MVSRHLPLVLLSLLALTAAQAQFATQPQQQPAQPAAGGFLAPQPGEKTVTLNFKDTPIADAAVKLGELLDTVILVDSKVEGTVTASREVPARLALMAVAGQAQAQPKRCIIFCTTEQARGAEELKTDVKVKMGLEKDTKLSTIALVLAAATKETVRCTPEAADLLATAKNDTEQPLVDVLNGVAEKAKCKWVYGWVLMPVNPQDMLNGLSMFEKLPAEQRQKMMEQGVETAFSEYRKLSPQERANAVQGFVSRIDRLAQTIAKADPETQARIKAAIKPMIEVGVRKFVMLDAADQAGMMPAIRALDKLR
ncbi:MAG: hypothetical protein HZB16_23470 [Armatimonadetes bacterium]|nr:hypothetical protein [Armatimonadota bacterium]